jgi:hypothetical protein
MEHHDLTEYLDRRLRAARPRSARVDESAFDAALLNRLRIEPIAPRRSVPRAVAFPVAAGVTLTVTAMVVLAGAPGRLGGPSAADAITQTLHWLNPAPGKILHARSVETMGGHTTTREFWQSADDPASQRELVEGSHTYEIARDGIYDPARNTIYTAGTLAMLTDAMKRKAAASLQPDKSAGLPPGDPAVAKVRVLLRDDRMSVHGPELHNGTEAWAISLKESVGRPVWTLWVSTADGRPLELRDPGRDASEPLQVTRWQTYEVLDRSHADQVTLTGAHPSATVVRDSAQAAAAERRLELAKG